MKKELPVTFRISHSCPDSVREALAHSLKNEFSRIKGHFITSKNGDVIDGPIVLPINWMKAAYQLTISNKDLNEEKGCSKFASWLQREVTLGHIVRQELVSMIPASLLDIHHDHTVLDVCASPGSKTEQLLGNMVKSAKEHNVGVLVANDVDSKRIHTLQSRLSASFCALLVVSNVDATKLTEHFASDPEIFDRIVCDVPCSGDGTFRKSPHFWRLFRPRMGLEFHTLQYDILCQAVEVCKVGGKVVYSTCSLNPLEDEAVIAAVLRKYSLSVRLISADVAGKLPGLRYRAGVSEWQCDQNIFTIGESAQDKQDSLQRLPAIQETMHPPSSEEKQSMHLEYCMRIFPQDQNTGGFFIAVLEKYSSTATHTQQRTAAAAAKAQKNEKVGKQPAVNSLQVVKIKQYKSEKKVKVKAMQSLGYNPKDVAGDVCLNRQHFLRELSADLIGRIERQMNCSLGKLAGSRIILNRQTGVYYLLSSRAHDLLFHISPSLPALQCGMPVFVASSDLTRKASAHHSGIAVSRQVLGEFFSPFHSLQLPYDAYSAIIKKIAQFNSFQSSAEEIDAIDSESTMVEPDIYLVFSVTTTEVGPATVKSLSISVYSLHKDRRDFQTIHSAELPSEAAVCAYEAVRSSLGKGAVDEDYPVFSISAISRASIPSVVDGDAPAPSDKGAGQKRRMSKAERKRAKKLKTGSSVTDHDDQDADGDDEDAKPTQTAETHPVVAADALTTFCCTHVTILPTNHVESTLLKRHTYASGHRDAMMICRVASPLQWCVAQDSYMHSISKMLNKD
eukprot:gene29690-35838_t